MSYSTFMYVYDWRKNKDFKTKLNEAVKIYNLGVDEKFVNGGYWDEDKKETIADFIKNSLLSSIKDYCEESAFCFCNHDGINDEEVKKLFIIFSKILSSLCHNVLISLRSDYEDFKYFICYDYGLLKCDLPKDYDINEEISVINRKYELAVAMSKKKAIDLEIEKLTNKPAQTNKTI